MVGVEDDAGLVATTLHTHLSTGGTGRLSLVTLDMAKAALFINEEVRQQSMVKRCMDEEPQGRVGMSYSGAAAE